MTKMKRLASGILALALCCCALLTGCSAPRLTIGGTADTAATIGDTTLSTGEYLAYLYNVFYDSYYSQGLYQYAQYYDVWEQEYTYGEGDDAKTVKFDEYLKLSAQDAAVRQVVLEKMMKEYDISWDEEELKALEESLASVKEDGYLALGINREHFVQVTKKLSLNETSLFYSLYGEKGQKAVSEADRKAYFDKNYVSYKMISIPLIDDNGSELSTEKQKEVTDKLEGYLAQYTKSGNFEAVVDAYNKENAEEGEEVTASKDEDNRQTVDASQSSNEKLMEAVRSVDVGKAKVVTYKSGGTTLTAALVLRLDIHSPETLFADKTKDILYGMKYEEFNADVKKAMAEQTAQFKKSVVRKCDPQNFLTDATA